jgi:D-alanyl-D-alanine carboxypeptidase
MKNQASITRLLLAAGLTLLGGCDTGDTMAEPEGFPDGYDAKMQAMMDGTIEVAAVPGISVHVDHPEHGEWSGVAGIASLEDKDPMDVHLRARAGSVLKTAIAVAVLQEMEDGGLSLDDTVAERLGELASRVPNADRITIEMLLRHRTGIPDWVTPGTIAAIIADPTHVWTLDEELQVIADQGAQFEPDAQFGYSNTNYNLLGAILEEVTGKGWREIVESQVFAPAGMTETFLPSPGDASCAGCARGYETPNGEPIDFTEIDPSMAGAAGGHALVTTPRDLSVLLRTVLEGDLFDDPATLSLMMDFRPAGTEGIDEYGMGLIHSNYGGIEVIGHLGGTAGYQSFNLYLPADGQYVSGFINQDVGESFFEVGVAVLGAATEENTR